MGDLPSGVVTFMFTDIEGSTQLLRQLGDEAFGRLLEDHHALIRSAVSAHGGSEVNTEGDGFFLAFPVAQAALAAAIQAQVSLRQHRWPEGRLVRVRMGLHCGRAEPVGDDYVALAVHQAARVVSAANGDQILCTSDVVSALRSHDGANLRELGRYRLRDFDAAPVLFEVVGSGLVSSGRAPRAPRDLPQGLRRPRTSLVGREAELTACRDLVTRERMLTIVAPGGAGKTRLAVECASEAAHSFADGAFFVDFGLVAEAAQVVTAVASSLGAVGSAEQDPIDVLVDHVRDLDALVIFDNCEHLTTTVAELAETLLSGTSRLVVLATSREPLGVDGERCLPLSPLGLPAPAETDLHAIADSDAVRLFLERVVAADPAFALTADTGPMVASLVRELDGLPLAIELAAARAASLGLQTVFSRLDEQLRLLGSGQRSRPTRHQTLEAVIAWSYELLAPVERTVLRRLSVFQRGFTATAAAQVTGFGDVAPEVALRVIASLVEKNLVRLLDPVDHPRGGAMQLGTETRFRLLFAVGLFALERLEESGETAQTRSRHFEWVLGVASAASAGILGPDVFVTQQRFQEELSNLDAAIAWSTDNDAAGALRLAVAASWPRNFLGGHRATRDALAAALQANSRTCAVADERLGAHARHALIRTWFLALGPLPEAEGALTQVREELQRLGDADGATRALQDLAEVLRLQGRYPEALTGADNALAYWTNTDNRFWKGWGLLRRADILKDLGRLQKAREDLLASLAIFEAEEALFWAAAAQGTLAAVYGAQGDFRTKRALLLRVLDVVSTLGDERSCVIVYRDLSSASLELGDRQDAVERMQLAWSLIERRRMRSQIPASLVVIIKLLLAAQLDAAAARVVGCLDRLVADDIAGFSTWGLRDLPALRQRMEGQLTGEVANSLVDEGGSWSDATLISEIADLLRQAQRRLCPDDSPLESTTTA